MDATLHLSLSAALTMRVRNPLLAVCVGLISHGLLDTIVWIMPFAIPVLVDLAVGMCLVLLIVAMAPRPWSALSGAVAGILPDANRVFANEPDLLQQVIHLPYVDITFPWSVLTQVAIVVFALVLALHWRRKAGPADPVRGGVRA